MKKIISIFLLITYMSFAVLPPYVYERYKKNAPDVFLIVVNKITELKINSKKSDIIINAKVIAICRAKDKVKINDHIVISYHINRRESKRWVGPIVNIPILDKKSIYKAYLKKIGDNHYVPVAKNKSFVYLPLKEEVK